MDYRYHTLSDHSLQTLLRQHTSLRYEAQLELMQELQQRGVAQELLLPLQQELDRKKQVLQSLGFLHEMGFDVTTQGDTTTIKRRLGPQLTELAALFLGVVLVFVGMYGVLQLYYLFTGDGGAGLQALLFNILWVVLGVKGVKMLGGLSRFINFWGMEFSFSPTQVQLVKRFDFKKETRTGTPTEVHIEPTEDTLLLQFQNETVLVANPKSFTQQETLKSLVDSIHTGKVPQHYQHTNYAS